MRNKLDIHRLTNFLNGWLYMSQKKVLVTGTSGYIATQLIPVFKEKYELTLLDIKNKSYDNKLVKDVIICDITNSNLNLYRKYFKDVDVVVHLAYHGAEVPFYERDYFQEKINIDIAFNIYQLSFEEGVQRVVVASSNHATDWYEHLIHSGKMDIIDPEIKSLSYNYYGWAKEAIETLGFLYACKSSSRRLEIVQIRIGAPREIRFRDCKTIQEYKRDLGAYISERDLQQLFIKSIESTNIENDHGIPFQIFYGISNNTRAFWSIVNARKVIGYEPRDDSELKFVSEISKYIDKSRSTIL